MSERAPGLNSSEILIYRSEDGMIRLDVRLEKETLWMAQSDMARLFQCSADNISLHLKNIYDEGELDPEATAEEFSVVRQRAVLGTSMFLNFTRIHCTLYL